MRAAFYIFMLAMSLPALPVAPAWSQVEAEPRLDAIWEAYQALDYATAQQLAQAALEAFKAPEDLAQVHIVLGLIAFSQNDQVVATRQFTDALVLDPTVELDPLLASPKTLDFFRDIRTSLAQANRDDALESEATPRYVLVRDRRAEAALRSMVVPGWGQLYKGQRTKGQVLVGLWIGTAAGTVTTHILRQQSRDTYLDATTPAEAIDRYDTFNQWHKTRNALVLGTAAVWVYSYLDALIGGQTPDRRNLLIAPTFSDRQMRVSVQVQF